MKTKAIRLRIDCYKTYQIQTLAQYKERITIRNQDGKYRGLLYDYTNNIDKWIMTIEGNIFYLTKEEVMRILNEQEPNGYRYYLEDTKH